MPGIEPGASHMQSVRSTTELHPLVELSIVSQPCRACTVTLEINRSLNIEIVNRGHCYVNYFRLVNFQDNLYIFIN